MSRSALPVAALALVGMTAALAPPPRGPLLLWNTTASAPRGLWRVSPATRPARGDWVVARPPRSAAGWLAAGGYLPDGVPLLKAVAARPGDLVCARHGALVINRRLAARVRVRDRRGRPLAAWRGCRRLRADELLLLSQAPGSLDGRYFGPSRLGDVLGVARPLAVARRP